MDKATDAKEKEGTTTNSGARAPSFSGYTLFTQEFFSHKDYKKKEKGKEKNNRKGKGKGKGKGVEDGLKNVNPFKKLNIEVRDAWNRLSDKERGEYSKRAEKLRGPGKGKTYVVPFLTRCAPKQFMAVCKHLKDRPDVMKRLKRIGFDKLVHISCPQIHRALCAEFMRCFDPPTKQVTIRGQTRGVGSEDVHELLGLPNGGVNIQVQVEEDDVVLNDLRSVYKKVKYQTIGEWLMGNSDENLEFLFVVFALGTLLSPSASIYVSERVLKLMTVTKDGLSRFDWSSFILNEMSHAIGEFKRELLKGKGKGRKTVGGCIYFLMIYCLQHFPLGKLHAPRDEDAMTYWNDERVRSRVVTEKDSKKGLLHGGRNAGRNSCSTFNPDTMLTHPEVRRTYSRLVSMVGEELLALQNRLEYEKYSGDDVTPQVHHEEGNYGGEENEDAGDEAKEDDGEEENDDDGEEENDDDGEDDNDDTEDSAAEKSDGKGGDCDQHADESEHADDSTSIELLEAHGEGDQADTQADDPEELGDEKKERELELRRSKRVITPSWAVKSPWIDTTRKGKGKRKKDEKDILYELCTTRCGEEEGQQ